MTQVASTLQLSCYSNLASPLEINLKKTKLDLKNINKPNLAVPTVSDPLKLDKKKTRLDFVKTVISEPGCICTVSDPGRGVPCGLRSSALAHPLLEGVSNPLPQRGRPPHHQVRSP